MDFKVRLLTSPEVSGCGITLDVIKKYGRIAYATDFCIYQGCICSDSFQPDGVHCAWSTMSEIIGWNKFKYYKCDGVEDECQIDYYSHLGVRPVIKYSDVSYMCKDFGTNPYGVREVLFGEYPQMAVDYDLKEKISKIYSNNKLDPTGKCYSSSNKYMGSDKLIEYEYEGNKYVRMLVSPSLSKYTSLKSGNLVWIKVEPIVWLLDEKNDLLISKNALFSNVHMEVVDEYNLSFTNSSLDRFLNEYFAKEIMPINTYYTDLAQKRLKRELKEIKTEMNELVKDEKVSRYIELLSRNIALTNELKNVDVKDKEKVKEKQLIIDMSERMNMKIINAPTYLKQD